MGWFDFLKAAEEPTASQIQKAIKAVTQPHGEAAVRMAAADRLKGWGTKAAVAGLMRRFTIHTPSGQVDLEECQEVERMLVELGDAAVEPIISFLGRESAVAYPARALSKILPKAVFVDSILGVLAKLDSGFGSHEEQREGLLRVLQEVDDPRIAPSVLTFLTDPVDDVAIAAMACVASSQDATHRSALTDLLLKCGDRPRVRQEVAEMLARLGWPLGEDRGRVEPGLPPGFSVDKKGRVVAL